MYIVYTLPLYIITPSYETDTSFYMIKGGLPYICRKTAFICAVNAIDYPIVNPLNSSRRVSFRVSIAIE